MVRSEFALRRVRRAYECAHLLRAFHAMGVAVVVCLLAVWLYGPSSETWLVGSMLLAVLGALAWQGGAWRRGALAGIVAGLPALIAPSVVMALSSPAECAADDTSAIWTCIIACFGAGSLVGIIVGIRAVLDVSPRRFAIGALVPAALTGLLGCGALGVGGAIGVVVSVFAGGVTGWLVAGHAARA